MKKLLICLLVCLLVSVPLAAGGFLARTENKVVLDEGQVMVPGEGKADLIIEWLGMGGTWPFSQSAWAQVKNIGDADVTGYLSVYYSIRRLGFFTVHYGTVTEEIVSWQLTPGGPHATFILVGGGALPRFGLYRFDAEVNPDRKFEESDYSNNRRTSWCFAFDGRWF